MITYEPVGFIHTPFRSLNSIPIQPVAGRNFQGYIDILPEYHECLQDLAGFSHIILIYHFHLSQGFTSQVVPFLDKVPRGLFATRAPRRPNQIGLSTVSLDRIEKNRLFISNIDIVDGTPLLDIKPWIQAADCPDLTSIRSGWLEEKGADFAARFSDNRFTDQDG